MTETEITLMVELEWEDGSIYRTPETWYEEEDDETPIGEWNLADYEKDIECPGYGFMEMMAQDDDHSGLWYKSRGKVIRIAAWKKT